MAHADPGPTSHVQQSLATALLRCDLDQFGVLPARLAADGYARLGFGRSRLRSSCSTSLAAHV
jgi:hypothetical protein